MDRFGLAGEDAGHAERARNTLENRLAGRLRKLREREAERSQAALLRRGEVILVLREELERAVEHAVVHRRLDGEHVELLVREPAHAHDARVERARGRVHVRVAIAHDARIVVRAQAAITAESDRHRLVTAVHRDEVQVDVDDEVALNGSAVELDLFALFGRAEIGHAVGVLAIVVVELLRPVGVEDLVADDVANLPVFHAAMHAGRDDHLDIVDAVIREQIEHDGEHPFANVGAAHRRKRQRDVVDRDRDLHPRPELRVEGLRVVRVVDRVANRGVDVLQPLDGRLGIEHAGAGRQIDFDELVAGEEHAGRASAVEGDDAGVAHDGALRRPW